MAENTNRQGKDIDRNLNANKGKEFGNKPAKRADTGSSYGKSGSGTDMGKGKGNVTQYGKEKDQESRTPDIERQGSKVSDRDTARSDMKGRGEEE